MKQCRSCRESLPIASFHRDQWRSDGHADHCRACRSCNTGLRYAGPPKYIRMAMAQQGLAWCRDCTDWRPSDNVRCGRCRLCQRAADRARYADDPDYRHRRRQHAHSRKRGVAPLPTEAALHLLQRFDGRCAYCGATAESWDHIVPVSKGGQTSMGNIVPACLSCNSSKHDRDLLNWAQSKGLSISLDVVELIALATYGG